MSNINDRESAGRADLNLPENTNPNGDNHRVNHNLESYDSGYVHGKTIERQRSEANQQLRDENNTANGFLGGVLLVGLIVAAIGGGIYFATQRNRTPEVIRERPVIVPSASPSPSSSPQVQERVIERDRIVPVPQPASPAPTIVIPQPQSPRTEQPATTQPKQTQPEQSSPAPSEAPRSNTSPSEKSQSDTPRSDAPSSAPTTTTPQPANGN